MHIFWTFIVENIVNMVKSTLFDSIANI